MTALDQSDWQNMTEPNLRRLVGIQVVSKYIDVSIDTVYTMVAQRRIPFIKVGRLLKFDLKAIDLWLAQHTVMPMPTIRP